MSKIRRRLIISYILKKNSSSFFVSLLAFCLARRVSYFIALTVISFIRSSMFSKIDLRYSFKASNNYGNTKSSFGSKLVRLLLIIFRSIPYSRRERLAS